MALQAFSVDRKEQVLILELSIQNSILGPNMEFITPEVGKVLIASITAFFTSVTAIGVAVVSKKNEIKHKETIKETLQRAEKAERQSHHIKQDHAKLILAWFKTFGKIDQLIANTEIDRVLVLTAINGIKQPKYVTAYFQRRSENQDEVEYIDIKIDDHYRSLLEVTVQTGYVYFVVQDLPTGVIIKNIYEMENVKSSMWVLIGINELGNEKKSITFASLSTHKDGGISASTQTQCIITRDLLSKSRDMF